MKIKLVQKVDPINKILGYKNDSKFKQQRFIGERKHSLSNLNDNEKKKIYDSLVFSDIDMPRANESSIENIEEYLIMRGYRY